jgi:hypothetical protein
MIIFFGVYHNNSFIYFQFWNEKIFLFLHFIYNFYLSNIFIYVARVLQISIFSI